MCLKRVYFDPKSAQRSTLVYRSQGETLHAVPADSVEGMAHSADLGKGLARGQFDRLMMQI